jgi:predicted metalloprotease with PDZ domain
MRPRSLEPFDFERANVSTELWLAEGFTSYYDDIALRRAGIIGDAEFAGRLGGAIDAVQNGPGRRLRSPMEMSRRAPFVDAAVSIDPQNVGNTFISYYTWGSVVAAGLDLSLRTRMPSVTLDHFLREMWSRHGATEAPYTVEDVEAALTETAGDGAFAADFLGRFVRGTEVPDFETLLEPAGMVLRRSRPGAATFGRVSVAQESGALAVTAPTLVGEPLHEAGIDLGDRILALDGIVAAETSLAAVAASRAPGDTVGVRFASRGFLVDAQVVLQEDPRLEVVLFEALGRTVTPDVAAFREAWLGPSSGS